MKICGIEIKGGAAYFVGMQVDEIGGVELISALASTFSVKDDEDFEELKEVSQDISAFLSSAEFDCIVIKQRTRKGKMMGSPAGFKLEALIQVSATCDVHVVKASDLKRFYGAKALPLEFSETELFAYQEQAYVAANYGVQKLV